MSEYQYYEFQAIDNPLTESQMRELRSISSRASITPTHFSNFYTFGDLKANPDRMVEKYLAAYLYLANWGTRRFSLRLPRPLLDLDQTRLYCAGESASAKAKDKFVILDFCSEDENGDEEEEGQGWLSSLIPLRADISGGDYRALYLSWLLGALSGELEDDAIEPPCPPGLGTLSAPLRAFADFLRIDDDLIEVAAAASPPRVGLSSGKGLERWVSVLSDSEKTSLLVNLVREGESHVRAQLLRRFRAAGESSDPSGASPQLRTVADLLALARRRGEERNRKEAERQARERVRREREAAVARDKYLAGLAQREPETWAKVDALVATRRPGDYDQAAQLLKDLSDLGLRSGRSAEIETRIRQLQEQHGNKQSFLRRLAQCGLAPADQGGSLRPKGARPASER